MEALLDRPPTDVKPPQRKIPISKAFGGRCRCACHQERVHMLAALVLSLFGAFSYWLGKRA